VPVDEEERIVLVDQRGQPTGTTENWSSHHAAAPPRFAFFLSTAAAVRS
jgi:isopentenyldiphosphate isomerase